jgi:hypothetical protein
MKERFPKDYASIIDTLYDGYVGGQTDAEILAAVRREFLPIIAAYKPFADDEVVIEVGKLYAEQYAALGAKDPMLCYLYASGTSGGRNFSSDIPASLIQREYALSERVIATATKRPNVAEQMLIPLWQKVAGQLVKRFGAEKTNLLQNASIDPPMYRDYCAVSIAFLQEITNLKQNEAAALMRETLRSVAVALLGERRPPGTFSN